MNAIRNGANTPDSVRTPVAATVAAAALIPCVLLGNTAVLTWLGARAAWLMLPTSLGVPFAFPRLTFTAMVGQPVWHHAVELVAVVLLAAVAAWWTSRALALRPGANPWRSLLSAWTGVLLGLALANALRAAAAVLAAGAGPLVFLSYTFAGAVVGLLWAVALGWVCAAPAALVHWFTARARPEPAPA